MSKLLLAINSGKSQDLKGKTLEDIEVSDNYESDSESDSCKGYEMTNINTTSLTDELERDVSLGSSTIQQKGLY